MGVFSSPPLGSPPAGGVGSGDGVVSPGPFRTSGLNRLGTAAPVGFAISGGALRAVATGGPPAASPVVLHEAPEDVQHEITLLVRMSGAIPVALIVGPDETNATTSNRFELSAGAGAVTVTPTSGGPADGLAVLSVGPSYTEGGGAVVSQIRVVVPAEHRLAVVDRADWAAGGWAMRAVVESYTISSLQTGG